MIHMYFVGWDRGKMIRDLFDLGWEKQFCS